MIISSYFTAVQFDAAKAAAILLDITHRWDCTLGFPGGVLVAEQEDVVLVRIAMNR